MKQLINNYSGIILLIIGITAGSFLGIFFPKAVDYVKPLGDIFLNLLFVSVVPLVFFAVSNSIASLEELFSRKNMLALLIFAFLTGTAARKTGNSV